MTTPSGRLGLYEKSNTRKANGNSKRDIAGDSFSDAVFTV